MSVGDVVIDAIIRLILGMRNLAFGDVTALRGLRLEWGNNLPSITSRERGEQNR